MKINNAPLMAFYKTLFIIIVANVFTSCNNTSCDFNAFFLEKNPVLGESPEVYLNTEDCKSYRLSGKIVYNFKVIDFILDTYLKDKVLYTNDNEVIFDFKTKKSGVIDLSNNIKILIKPIMNLQDEANNTFTLFELSNVYNYYGESLNLVLVCSLKYGIVGQFLSNSLNEYQMNYQGYAGVKNAIDKLFIKKELL